MCTNHPGQTCLPFEQYYKQLLYNTDYITLLIDFIDTYGSSDS